MHGTPTGVAVGRGRVFVAAAPRRRVPPAGGIRIGVIADCRGGFSFAMQQVLAGAELPLINRGAHLRGAHPSSGLVHATVAGHPVTLIPECESWSDTTITISALARLVERDHASIVLGPPFEGDSLAVRDFAHAHPHVTFMFTGFDQSATLRHHARNAYRFETDAVMWYAGLGTYARRTLGWNTATTASNTDTSGWSSVQAFQAEFCSEGGHITPKHGTWVDVADGEQFGATLPTGVDGVFLPGGTPGPFGGTFNFVPRWAKAHPPVGQHLMVGWAVLVADPTLVGIVGSSSDPYAPTPAFNRYLAQYAAAFPNDPDPGLTNQSVYDAMEPVLEALQQVHGDLSNGQRRFRFALAHLRYHAPEGLITLDKRHQGIVPIYIAKVVRSGRLHHDQADQDDPPGRPDLRRPLQPRVTAAEHDQPGVRRGQLASLGELSSPRGPAAGRPGPLGRSRGEGTTVCDDPSWFHMTLPHRVHAGSACSSCWLSG